MTTIGAWKRGSFQKCFAIAHCSLSSWKGRRRPDSEWLSTAQSSNPVPTIISGHSLSVATLARPPLLHAGTPTYDDPISTKFFGRECDPNNRSPSGNIVILLICAEYVQPDPASRRIPREPVRTAPFDFQRVASNQDGRPFPNRYSTAVDGVCNYTDDGCFASKHYTNGCSGHPSGTVAYTHCS